VQVGTIPLLADLACMCTKEWPIFDLPKRGPDHLRLVNDVVGSTSAILVSNGSPGRLQTSRRDISRHRLGCPRPAAAHHSVSRSFGRLNMGVGAEQGCRSRTTDMARPLGIVSAVQHLWSLSTSLWSLSTSLWSLSTSLWSLSTLPLIRSTGPTTADVTAGPALGKIAWCALNT
jgi:hypothetical protein